MNNTAAKIYGLIGKNISYSFSAGYFKNKFLSEKNENCIYKNFDISSIEYFKDIIENTKNLSGLNVTIPYKEQIIPYLDELSENAQKIGAVNTIRFCKSGKLKGYNTDYYGFKKALRPLLKPYHKKALVLGTGGASKAIAFALKKAGIEYRFVSRKITPNIYSYNNLNKTVFDEYQIIINTTPLGTYPDIEECPDLDYSLFTKNHLAFDLIYNPAETVFLKKARQMGADTENGYKMLIYQAEKAWEIWNR